MENDVREVLKKAVNDMVFPGAVVGIVKENKSHVIPYGGIDESKTSVDKTTVYDVASITKAIPTSSLALYFLDQKALQLTDPVGKFLPLFTHRDVTIWHLLTQTVLFSYSSHPLVLSSLKDTSAKEIMKRIYSADISKHPGTVYAYNNATSILLGKVIEQIGGEKLDQLASEIFFEPLGMMHTTFHPLLLQNITIAPSEIDAWRGGVVKGEVHDESSYTLSQDGVVGSAGLFSTAEDLMRFASMLLQKGYFKGKHYFTEEMIGKMYENQLASKGLHTGLGWEIHQPQYMGNYMTEMMFGKTGFTGCLILLDIPRQKAVVLLSNYTYPKRKENAKKINQVRREIVDIVFSQQ